MFKVNFITETAFISQWYLLETAFRKSMMSDGSFTVMCSPEVKKHNNWEYNLYPTVMSKIH
jgi:hypothetical protein